MGAVALLASLALGACHSEKPSRPKVAGDAAKGKLLLARFQCGSCHRIPGVEGAAGTAGPPLTDIASRSYLGGHLPNDPDVMVRWIVNPRALLPGTTMPAMGVSPDDARHMAAYLYTLK
ncbi:c-type cytochrome [Pseudoduganella sp. UC29_106]|uniref:c-type cytochrome n=1 Tax=Pseudoduganella sp. UC29_106 TaxID=3374553 RepID=UPI0037574D34